MPCCVSMAFKEDSMCLGDQKSILGHCLSYCEAEDSFQRKKDIETAVKTPVPPKTPVKFSPWFRVERKASLVTFKSDKSKSVPLSDLYSRLRPENYMDQVFRDVTQVGEGHFGKVYRVVSREDNQVYAVKVSKEIFHNENERSKRFEEVRKHELIPLHPNCIRLYNAWEEQARLYLWLEFCDISLEDYAAKNHEISEWKVWEILLDLLLGLKNLHDNHLVHVDVKLENILMTADGVCKLADFGLLVDMSQDTLPPKNVVEGDGRYLAPELLLGGPFSAAVDVYSLGLCILELATDIVMPKGGEDWQMLRRGEIPIQKTSHLSEELKCLITQMITPDHLRRPTVDTLLTQPRLQHMWCERRRNNLAPALSQKSPPFPLTVFMAIINLLIFLLSVPLKITEVVRRKNGRPERERATHQHDQHQHSITSTFSGSKLLKRRLINGSASAAIPPHPRTWNMQVSDDELEVAAMMGDDILASSTPFNPPTPCRSRGVRSVPSSHRTLNFAINDSASSSSASSTPPTSPSSSYFTRPLGSPLNSVGENARTSPISTGDSPCASPDFILPHDTSRISCLPQNTLDATPQVGIELPRPPQSRPLPITGRNLLCSFNSSEEDSDEERMGKKREKEKKKRGKKKR